MAQMAQQEPIVIKCGWLGAIGNISEEVKTKLRKCFLRGTLMDVQLDCDTDETDRTEVVGVRTYQVDWSDATKKEPKNLNVSVYSAYEASDIIVECGEFQSSDYEDNVPLDE